MAIAFFKSACVEATVLFAAFACCVRAIGGVQVGFRCPDQFLLRLNRGLRRLQICLRLHAFLIGCDSRFGQFDGATAVALRTIQSGLSLQQLRLRR